MVCVFHSEVPLQGFPVDTCVSQGLRSKLLLERLN
jgi:hypothetical protein